MERIAFRSPLPLPARLLVLSSALQYACDADLKEGCIGGECSALQAGTPSAAGGSAGEAGGTSEGGKASACDSVPLGDYPCDVFAILEAKCFRCHTDPPSNGEITPPFPLVSFANVHDDYLGKPIWQRIETAIADDFMPLNPPKLTEAEKDTLVAWLSECAPPAEDGEGCR